VGYALRAVVDIAYRSGDARGRPVVSFEVQPLGGQTTGPVVANAKRVLREAWRTL